MKRARVVKELCFQTAVVDALHRMVEEEERRRFQEVVVDAHRRRVEEEEQSPRKVEVAVERCRSNL